MTATADNSPNDAADTDDDNNNYHCKTYRCTTHCNYHFKRYHWRIAK